MESRFLVVDGIRAHCVVAGQGPPLLLTPGLGASVVLSWKRVVQPLTEHFTIFALDLPGSGDSDRPDVSYNYEDGIAFLLGALDALGIERTHIMGSSAGGLLSTELALRYPERIERLALVASAGMGREIGWFLRLCTVPLLGEALMAPHRRLLRWVLRGAYAGAAALDEDALAELHRVRQMPGTRRAFLRVLRQHLTLRGLRQDLVLLDRLPQLRPPTLLLWGERDGVIPVAHAYAAAQRIPNCRLEVFPGCGHDPAWERPERFRQVLCEFLLAPVRLRSAA